MPEGYTHSSIGLRAADAAGWHITSREAFMAGANGPDMLFCYQAWKPGPKRRINLPALGNRMHAERTGAFLQALSKHAVTPVQQDYFLGFLCHYATDTVVHPYVEAVTRCCAAYGGPTGHGRFEIALDSHLHEKATGNPAVPLKDITPRLTGVPLAEVIAQLRRAIDDTYGIEVPGSCLVDAFNHNYFLRSLFASKTPLKIRQKLFRVLECFIGGKGYITGHLTPAKLRGISSKDVRQGIRLPNVWQDPYTGETREENIYQLLEKAEMYSTLLLREATALYTGWDLFWPLVGSKDYTWGAETPQSTLPAVDQKVQTPQKLSPDQNTLVAEAAAVAQKLADQREKAAPNTDHSGEN